MQKLLVNKTESKFLPLALIKSVAFFLGHPVVHGNIELPFHSKYYTLLSLFCQKKNMGMKMHKGKDKVPSFEIDLET